MMVCGLCGGVWAVMVYGLSVMVSGPVFEAFGHVYQLQRCLYT